MGSSLFTWAGVEEWRAESALVVPEQDRFTASGVQLGVDPVPYRLDYRLETTAGWVTTALDVIAVGSGWRRSLQLGRGADGRWFCRADSEGDADLPEPGCDAGLLTGAIDCDLGFSPLTNTMPILRHRLHRQPGAIDFTMAWVSAPDLGVQPSPQRYEHLRTTPDGAVVAFSSGSFHAALTVDAGGIVLDYPGLARRVS
jgi:uncharacterized protein